MAGLVDDDDDDDDEDDDDDGACEFPPGDSLVVGPTAKAVLAATSQNDAALALSIASCKYDFNAGSDAARSTALPIIRGSAPASTSNRAATANPCSTAYINGVSPFMQGWFGSAPLSSSSFTPSK